MITFSKRSIPGFVLDKMSPFEISNVDNVCQLVRRLLVTVFIMWPIALITGGMTLGSFLTALVCDFMILTGHLHFNTKAWWYTPTVAWNFVVLITVLVAIVVYFKSRSYDRRFDDNGNRIVKQPGLIKTYYRAWKDKYCPLVVIK
jgi:hypothetical protein